MKSEYNSKSEKNVESFIQKRIEGKSFDEIASELNVTKSTLIEWNKKVAIRTAINEGKAIRINAIVKSYQFNLHTRLTAYLELSQRIMKELSHRDLNDVSTESLLKMSITNDNRIKELTSKRIEIGQNPEICEVGGKRDGYFKLTLDD